MADPLAAPITGLLMLHELHHRTQAAEARFAPVRWYHLFRARWYQAAREVRAVQA